MTSTMADGNIVAAVWVAQFFQFRFAMGRLGENREASGEITTIMAAGSIGGDLIA